MKYLRYQDNDGSISYGILKGETITKIDGDLFAAYNVTKITLPLSDVKLLAPSTPTKIVAVGRNYFDHAKELGNEVPKAPGIFFIPSTSVSDPDDDVVYPPITQHVDYEGELGIVIKKTCTKVSKQEALEYVLGYTCVNDITARDLQKSDLQWARGKGMDGFTPFGPIITDEIDPGNTNLSTRVNGVTKQSSNTSLFMYDVPTVISFISQAITLLPGDVIATGTPAGVGPMQPGDIVEIEIEGIGILKNRIIK